MSTVNNVGIGLSGQTGTGAFVGSNSPMMTTPTIGNATGTGVTFSNTATGGVVGTTTNDSASSGIQGEFMSSVIPFVSSVSASGTFNVTSLTLPAGDWDIDGNVSITGVVTLNLFKVWASATSATQPDGHLSASYRFVGGVNDSGNCGLSIPPIRSSSSTSTTWFLSATIATSTGTIVACGGIYARRSR